MPLQHRQPQPPRLVRRDVLFGLLALAMWGGTAVKCFAAFGAWENCNSALGLVAIAVISVAWPILDPSGYLSWRSPALAFLQIFLFALPFNFSTEVFDVLAPHPGQGPTAVVYDLFSLAMSIRVALLLFTCIGWRLPLSLQFPIQGIKVALLAVFGTANYCRSKLLRSTQMRFYVDTVHHVLSLTGTPLMAISPASALIPHDALARSGAFVLQCWLLLGWCTPTLLLLPDAPGAAAAQRPAADGRPPTGQGPGGPGAAKEEPPWLALLESWMRGLLPGPPGAGADIPQGLLVALRWWLVVQLTWAACCVVAPLLVGAS